MATEKKIYAITLARGGSKGIPRKNIKLLGGKPLIAHTLDAARAAAIFSKIIVSTDDPEIAETARRFGAEIPFMRPPELAGDTTPVIAVLSNFAEWLAAHEGDAMPDYLVLLQPTSPLRTARHIREGVELLITTGADSVIGVTEVPAAEHPSWTFAMDRDGARLRLFCGGPVRDIIPLRQNLPSAYRTNGALFAFRTRLLREDPPTLYGDDVRGYAMDRRYSIDIDTPEDWPAVERALAANQNMA